MLLWLSAYATSWKNFMLTINIRKAIVGENLRVYCELCVTIPLANLKKWMKCSLPYHLLAVVMFLSFWTCSGILRYSEIPFRQYIDTILCYLMSGLFVTLQNTPVQSKVLHRKRRNFVPSSENRNARPVSIDIYKLVSLSWVSVMSE